MSQDLTRREALKRGAALAGGLIWATPVVQAVGISPALAQTTSPGAENCCIDENGDTVKLATLQMKYLGGDAYCSDSSFAQDPGKVSCTDFPTPPSDPLPDPAYIVASHQENIFENNGTTIREPARIWFSGSVGAGDTFVIDAGNDMETQLKGETWVHIFDSDPPMLSSYRQKVAFHTSCSEPLFKGDQFGSVVVQDCTADTTPSPSELETQSEDTTTTTTEGSTETTQESTTTTTEGSTETTQESTTTTTEQSTTTTTEGSTGTTQESTTTTTEARPGGPPEGVGPPGDDD